MPTYVYECLRCGEHFELLQGINDPPRQRCPSCRGKVRRVLMPGGGFIFKGSGFYITDYKRKEQKEQKEQKARADRGQDAKAEGTGAAGSAQEGGGQARGTSSGGTKGGSPKKAARQDDGH